MLAQLEELHPDELQIVYRHFPLLSIHDKASIAGQAAEAAGSQGSFWEMHDLLFGRFGEWAGLSPEDFMNWIESSIGDLDLNQDQFLEDLNSGRYESVMLDHFETGLASGLTGTPFLLINGVYFQLAPDLIPLEASIRLLLLEDEMEAEYPPMTIEPGTDYIARLHLDQGDVVIQLYQDSAPLAVNSFIYLAEKGWYDENAFHLVIPSTLVATGDPSGTGFGNPGYTFPIETDSALTFDEAGMVAISSIAPDMNGSQFFITLGPLSSLDGSRTIFGRVIEGLEILENLEERDSLTQLMETPEAIIRSITIEAQ
ncbi:MAG: thioredoxin domain-containing protein [Anaerolineales bacterium]|nr:thioredoxin domain-containing protein [Anaerolineales bacterium]